jgi:hypothetical protein
MIAWMLGAFASLPALAGLAVCLRRGPRRRQRLTGDQVAEPEVLANPERRENRHPTPDHQRPGRLPAAGRAAMASPAPGSADLVHGRLEKLVAWSGVQRTAPALPAAVDVAIRPPETGFGTAAKWRYRTGGQVRSGVSVSGRTVFAGSSDGNVHAVRA